MSLPRLLAERCDCIPQAKVVSWYKGELRSLAEAFFRGLVFYAVLAKYDNRLGTPCVFCHRRSLSATTARLVRSRHFQDFERELCVNSGGPRKRESESSRPIFRTGERNLEGCVCETKLFLQTESVAGWVSETRKA